MKYKIADLIVEFEAKFRMLKSRSNKYAMSAPTENKNIEIDITDEQIKADIEMYPEITAELAEYALTGTMFYRELLCYQGCLLHASSVVLDDEAYLFSAPCGTGKSTHTSLWLKFLADKKPYILNDDKPAIRLMEDGIYVYGTPFSGKYDINENKKVKLKAICFIEQAKVNTIRKVEPKEAIRLFYEQTTREISEEKMIKLLDILDTIIREIPIYKLYCDMSEEAVLLAYNTMKGENTNEN